MKISVVMATFNGIHYLEEQLESIRLQTLEPDEVIICDDASTDGTYEFICHYVNQFHLEKWKVMKNSENQGWIKNFYKLFESTNCDLIFCADQDDIWFNNKIQIMSDIMKSDTNIKVLGGNNIRVDAYGKNKKKIKITDVLNKGKLIKIEWNGRFYLTHRPGCALCFTKQLLPYINKMQTEFYPHDQLLWNVACILDGAYIINRDVILQRRHNESAMIKKKKQNDRIFEIENTLRIIKICKNNISLNTPNKIEKQKIIERTEKFFELRIAFMNRSNLKSGFQLLKYLSFYPRYRSFLADVKERLENDNIPKKQSK